MVSRHFVGLFRLPDSNPAYLLQDPDLLPSLTFLCFSLLDLWLELPLSFNRASWHFKVLLPCSGELFSSQTSLSCSQLLTILAF